VTTKDRDEVFILRELCDSLCLKAYLRPRDFPGKILELTPGPRSLFAPMVEIWLWDNLLPAMNVMNKANNEGFSSGFAVPAMLLNVTLGSLLVLGTGSFGLSSMHKLASMASYPNLNNQSQGASSLIAQDVRRASSVESASSDQIVLSVRLAEGIGTVAYTYDAVRHTLTRTDGRTTQTLLSDVDCFAFSLFQRPAADAAFNTLAPATTPNAKIVACHWSCSRKLAGAKLDSETVQIAPMVLRNRTI
jgi:hypothetical protein